MTMSTTLPESLSEETVVLSKVGKSSAQSYAFRAGSLRKRKETERKKNQPRKRGPKPRPKSAPMSKYRRKTANLRERLRMGEINAAFEKLRQKLPNPAQADKGKCEKLTKINILHVAINYIRAMENLLATGDSGIRSFHEMTKNPLRDESNSKLEMQRIMAVLMKKAEAKAAAEAAKSKNSSSLHHHAEHQSKREAGKKKKKTAQKQLYLDEEDSEDDEESWNLSAAPLADPFSSPERSSELNVTPPLASLSPVSTATATTSPCLSEDSGIMTASRCSSSSLMCVSPNVTDLKRQADPLFCSAAANMPLSSNSGNNDDFIKELFNDLVDMVDSLGEIPELDFEENCFI